MSNDSRATANKITEEKLIAAVATALPEERQQKILKTSLKRVYETAVTCPVAAAMELANTARWFHLARTANQPQVAMNKEQINFDAKLAGAFRNFCFQAQSDGRLGEAIEVCSRVSSDSPDNTAFTKAVTELWSASVKTYRKGGNIEAAKNIVASAHSFMEPIAPSQTFRKAVDFEMEKLGLTTESIKDSRPVTPVLRFKKVTPSAGCSCGSGV